MPSRSAAGSRRRRSSVYRLWLEGCWAVFRYQARHGVTLVAVAPRRPGELPHWERIEREWSVMPKKPALPGGVIPPAPAAEASKALDAVPLLRGYLLDATWEDSTEAREPSTIIVRPGGGAFNVTLKDPSTCSQLRLRVPKWEAILGALEALLTADNPPWELDPWQAERSRGKKKK